MIYKEIEQGTDAWLQIRKGKVTASRVADVMAKFASRDIESAVVGTVTESSEVWLENNAGRSLLWDWNEKPFITSHKETKQKTNQQMTKQAA